MAQADTSAESDTHRRGDISERDDISRQPLRILERWLEEARTAHVPGSDAVSFVTVGRDGRPSARTVELKRLSEEVLVFTSALWTRKARELALNPHVALLFYWPTLGRQVHVSGEATLAERELAVELFSERALARQVQSIVSRQGEPIEDIEVLRARHDHLMAVMEGPPECPADWGAIGVRPNAIEFWSEATDRMHDRLLYTREGDGWKTTRLAP